MTSKAIRPFGDDWLAVLTRVADKQRAIEDDGGILWFRGHTDASWTLNPTLHRYIAELEKAVGVDMPNKMLMAEEHKAHYHKFVTEAWPLLEPDERSMWGTLFAMQHNGHPTRLLDWTASFASALFFAQQRAPTTTAAVYMLVPEVFNEKVLGTRGLVTVSDDAQEQIVETNNFHPRFQHDYEPRSLAIQVRLINKRMVAQRSRFVVCGDDRRPLETQYPDVFDKIELPPTTFDDAARFLRLAGVDALTIFPDHEGFGRNWREGLHRYKKLLAKYAKPEP